MIYANKLRVSIKPTGNIWFSIFCMEQCFKEYNFSTLLYEESTHAIVVFPHKLSGFWEAQEDWVHEFKYIKNGNGAIINAGRFINRLPNLEVIYGMYSPKWNEEYKTLTFNLKERLVEYEK